MSEPKIVLELVTDLITNPIDKFYVQPIKIYNVKVILVSIVKIKNMGLTFGE